MFRIDDQTAAANLPALPTDSVGTPGYFTGGNPAAAQPATRLRFWWLNMVQEELIAIVQAAGIALAKGANNQVLAALRALFNVSASYSGANVGVVRLPGGIVLQSLTAQVPSGSGLTTTTVTLPVAFPANCLDAQICFLGNTPPTGAGAISVQPLSATQVAVTTSYTGGPSLLGVAIKATGN